MLMLTVRMQGVVPSVRLRLVLRALVMLHVMLVCTLPCDSGTTTAQQLQSMVLLAIALALQGL